MEDPAGDIFLEFRADAAPVDRRGFEIQGTLLWLTRPSRPCPGWMVV